VNGVEAPRLWTARWIGYDGTGAGQGLPIPVTEAGPMVVAGDPVRANLCRTIGMSGDGRTQSNG